jgi:hypothetical protein
MVFLQKKI